MDRSALQRLIPIVLVLIIVAVSVAALVSLGRTLFSGGGGESEPSKAPTISAKEELTKTLADRSVKMTVRGPIVANENFHSYTITVSPDSRNMTTYKGYVGEQIDSEPLDNNTKAYEEFVFALDRAGLMDGKPLEDEANDPRGICATGSLYEFEVLRGGTTIEKLWMTTCRGAQGSLKANLSAVSRLFQQQIPEYSKLVSGLRMNR